MTDITREEVEALAQATERQIAKGPRKTIKLLKEEMASASEEKRAYLQIEIDEEEAEERNLTIIIVALRAFAKSMDAEPVVPPGWRLVPIEPTEAMIEAHFAAHAAAAPVFADVPDIWRSMLAASPQPQPTER